MLKIIVRLLLSMTLLSLAGQTPACAHTDEPSEPVVHVVTTIAQIADVVRNVAGERASVEHLMGEGVDPHLYKVTRSDVARMMRADIVYYNGLLLEGKMTDSLIRIAQKKPVYAVTDLLDEDQLLEPEDFAGHYDPHVWMDPIRWNKAVEALRDTLIEQDPQGASIYRRNAEAYSAQIMALHEYAVEALSSIPDSSRTLVTAHDAFNYFADRYGFQVRGIQGISTESEAGVQDIENLVTLLVDRKVKAVFVESTVSERNIRALIDGAAARNHTVNIGGELYSDAMGAPGSYEGTYIGMIDHNVTTIARALGGTAPAGGFTGKLAGTH